MFDSRGHVPLSEDSSSTSLNIRERHYTLHEIATWLNISYDCARDLFKDEQGVPKIRTRRRKPHQKIRRTWRIPESVVRRVYKRLTGGEL